MNRTTFAAVVALLVLGTAGQALALDAYRDRRGLLFGVALGAGSGKADIKGEDAHIGFNLSARIGGGLSEQLTLDAEFGYHLASFEQTSGGVDTDRSNDLFSGMIGASFFVWQGLYLRAMAGVSHLSAAVDPGKDHSDTGLGFGGGAGFEFFANSDLAIGVGADYRYHSFEDFDFTQINFGVTATWY